MALFFCPSNAFHCSSEARSDLIEVCKLQPSNLDARKELELVKQRALEAKTKDKKVRGRPL